MNSTNNPDPPREDALNTIQAWLESPLAEQFFGNSWKLKYDILGCFLAGGNLSEVARHHGKKRQTASYQYRRLKTLIAAK